MIDKIPTVVIIPAKDTEIIQLISRDTDNFVRTLLFNLGNRLIDHCGVYVS
jgi:hypothetical protein